MIERRARGKRGLFRRTPDPKELGERVGRLAKRMLKDGVTRAGWKKDRFVVGLSLTPHGKVTLSVDAEADVVLRADTSFVGPVLAAKAIELVEPLLPELDVAWAEPFDLDDARRATCDWLAQQLRDGERDLGIERDFHVDAPVLTALGPRDAAWRDAVLADPLHGHDAFAWWDDLPGRESYARALLAMWHDIPWREPLDDDEHELMKRVDKDLRATHRADIDLELPWAEWAQIHTFLAVDDGYMQEVRRRATGLSPVIGYRRYDLDIELSGGWIVRVPGGFVGRWEDDGERYWSTDGQRSFEFSSVTAQDEADSEKLLAVAPARHPVIEQFSDGTRRGRVEVQEVDHTHVFHAIVADAPHVALATLKGRAQDREWAIATLRTLRQG